MGFKENLKKYRMESGYLTARQFAEEIGIPYSRYINYEGTKSSEPPYSELVKISKFLHVSIDLLLSNEVDDKSRLMKFAPKVLANTPFKIVETTKDTVTIQLGNTNKKLVLSKEGFLNNLSEETDAANNALLGIVSERVCISLKLLFLADADLSDDDMRNYLLDTNLYNIPFKSITAPLFDISK